jgi:hypothetical protein
MKSGTDILNDKLEKGRNCSWHILKHHFPEDTERKQETLRSE